LTSDAAKGRGARAAECSVITTPQEKRQLYDSGYDCRRIAAPFTIATISALTFSGSLAHAAPRLGAAGDEPFTLPFAEPFLDFLISGGAGSNSIAAD